MPRPWSEPRRAAADLAVCREVIRTGSRSFFAASLLLPRRVRDPAYALYAFCRFADDAVDIDDARQGAPARLRERLARIYDGRPHGAPPDRAFADVVARFAIPRELPEALIEGFEWDAQGRRYQDLSALKAYAARVAGTVGAMMALLMGARSPNLLARACDLGVAMQLTNIARDVGEDARAGRLYLPETWLLEAGIDPDAWLASPTYGPELASVVLRLLQAAQDLYERAAAGIAGLDTDCRPAIFGASFVYAEIGRELERSGLDSVTRRAVVSGWRKVGLLGHAWLAARLATARSPAPALAETQFLLDAVASNPAAALPRRIPWWDLSEQLGRTIELFEDLERRDRAHRIASGV